MSDQSDIANFVAEVYKAGTSEGAKKGWQRRGAHNHVNNFGTGFHANIRPSAGSGFDASINEDSGGHERAFKNLGSVGAAKRWAESAHRSVQKEPKRLAVTKIKKMADEVYSQQGHEHPTAAYDRKAAKRDRDEGRK